MYLPFVGAILSEKTDYYFQVLDLSKFISLLCELLGINPIGLLNLCNRE